MVKISALGEKVSPLMKSSPEKNKPNPYLYSSSVVLANKTARRPIISFQSSGAATPGDPRLSSASQPESERWKKRRPP